MKVSMEKLTILGLVVIMFAAGLFAGAIMFGGSDSPTTQTNVVHAAPAPDPSIQARVVCLDTSTHTVTHIVGPIVPIPKNTNVSSTAFCPSGFIATGGGHVAIPIENNGNVRITASRALAGQEAWRVDAARGFILDIPG